jgi:23S rRNA (cytidine2498-2'-O)-methyltransferase
MVRHGASVTAIDHGALKLPADKKFSERVTHLKENGLTYRPISPVDWVVCDMLVGSRETLAVLDRWLSQGLAKNFVFNVKLPQAKPWPVIRDALDLLARYPWAVMRAKHLFHDRQEITLMGSEHPKD